MEDVAGGDVGGHLLVESTGIRKGKKTGKSGTRQTPKTDFGSA